MTKAKRVLLVEDDALSAKLMRDVLQANGFDTCEVGDGAAAVSAALEADADVVVMDAGLPGIDGAEATRRLKSDPATMRLPVIAVTAYAMPEDEARMREAGCDVFLTKPLRLSEFVTLVADLSGRRDGLADSNRQ